VVDLHNHLVGTDIVEVNGVAMTTNHPIWVNDGWVLGEDIKVGDTIHQMKSSWSEPVPGLVTSVVRIPKAELGEFSVYNIFVAEHGNYVAGGLLASEDC
jgi:intein/homing endonuclease